MDDELLKQQSKIYAVPGVDESEPAGPKRKLKAVYTNGEEVSAPFPSLRLQRH